MSGYDQRVREADGGGGAGGGIAPGKRALTQSLAPRGAYSVAPPSGPIDASAATVPNILAPGDDPFGLHLLGQSRPLDPLGQSFADPSRDADQDGRADLLPRPAAGRSHGAPAHPSQHAAQLAAAVEAAIVDVNLIPSTLLPSYAAARDALDPAGLQSLAVDILTKYQAAIDVRDQVRAIVDPNDPGHAAYEVLPATPERAADQGALLPLSGAL